MDGWLVLASTKAALGTSINAERRPLSSTSPYRRMTQSDREPFAFALAKGNGGALALQRLAALGDGGLKGALSLWPVIGSELTAKITLDGPEAVVELGGLPLDKQAPPSIVGIPGDAWLAFGSNALARVGTEKLSEGVGLDNRYLLLLRRFLGSDLPRAVTRRLGRGTFFIQGGSAEDLSGELLAQIKDPRTAWRGLLALGRRLERAGTHQVDASGTGATYRFTAESRRPEQLLRFHIRIDGRQLRLEFGLPGSADELEDTGAYRQATAALAGPPRSLVRVEEVVRLLGLRGAKQALGLEQWPG